MFLYTPEFLVQLPSAVISMKISVLVPVAAIHTEAVATLTSCLMSDVRVASDLEQFLFSSRGMALSQNLECAL